MWSLTLTLSVSMDFSGLLPLPGNASSSGPRRLGLWITVSFFIRSTSLLAWTGKSLWTQTDRSQVMSRDHEAGAGRGLGRDGSNQTGSRRLDWRLPSHPKHLFHPASSGGGGWGREALWPCFGTGRALNMWAGDLAACFFSRLGSLRADRGCMCISCHAWLGMSLPMWVPWALPAGHLHHQGQVKHTQVWHLVTSC